MIYQPEYVKAILKRYMEGKASPVELARLKVAWNIYDDDELTDMIAGVLPELNDMADNDLDSWEPPIKEIISRSRKAIQHKNIRAIKKSLSAAAVYLPVIAGTVFLLWLAFRPSKLIYSCGHLPADMETPTGVYTCLLTLKDSCSILIDSTYKGKVAVQGNIEIIKLPTGELEYKQSSSTAKGDAMNGKYNTITTSRGDQYKVILPDGTKVRLNAASSIRFPIEFSATKREMEITGEVFFEVAPNKNAPLYVKVKNTEIKVIGTSFNVNAYSQKILTTLITGQLEIRNGTDSAQLKPGDEAVIGDIQQHDTINNSSIQIAQADTTEAVSWKKAMRVYTKITMKDFVLDMGRWYNLEMVNMDCVSNRLISITLCYDAPVSEVLKIFRKTGLHFNHEGNRIIFCEPAKKGAST